MLVPLATTRPLKRRALITPALIVANVLVYVVMTALSSSDPDLHAQAQSNLWVIGGPHFRVWQLVTSAFLHAGLMHIAGNMLFLWVFGPSVEDRFGRGGFLAFYLLAAAASGGLHALFDNNPAIGASGAIAAVTGAFLVLFPRTTIRCLFLIGLRVVPVPAWWFIGFAVAWDFLAQSTGAGGRVAHLAHLGGYAFGFFVAMVLLWTRVFPREPYDLFTMFRQAHRRRQFKAAGAIVDPARSKPALAAAKPDPRADELAAARAQAAHFVSARDLPAAADAYKQLVDRFGGDLASADTAATLSRDAQYTLANHFVQTADHAAAADAYERFLAAYPSDREANPIGVMLGRLYARYLAQPQRASGVLRSVLQANTDDAIKQHAQEELDALVLPTQPRSSGVPPVSTSSISSPAQDAP